MGCNCPDDREDRAIEVFDALEDILKSAICNRDSMYKSYYGYRQMAIVDSIRKTLKEILNFNTGESK